MTNPDVDPKIRKIVVNHLTEWVEKNPNLVKKLCQRMIAFAKATSSAKERMKKIVTVNQDKAGLEVTSKFLDCESNDPTKVEIFVVEGKIAELLSINLFNCLEYNIFVNQHPILL